MGLKPSVWLLFFTVIFKGVPADANLDKDSLDSTSVRERNVKGTQGGAVKPPVLPALPLRTNGQPPTNPWNLLPVDDLMRINRPSSYAEKTEESSRLGIKTPPTGPEKNVLNTVLYGMREPSDSNEKPLREQHPFISSDSSTSTTEKVLLKDQPTRKEEEAMLNLKVKASHVSQPSVGKITPDGTSTQPHKQTQGIGSKGTLRGSTPIPTSVTQGVSENKTEMPKKGAAPASDDDLVLLSLIDVPERDETTTCGPGERWHNNRCRTAIR